MSLLLWSQLALVCLLGAMSPGPSLALIIHNSINYNRLSGIVASCAHGLGVGIYAIVTIILLEFILRNSETIFFIIQIFGSIFLVFLGYLFLFKNKNEEEINKKINSNSFLQGFTIAIVNPKILVWFAAIYSQFISHEASIKEKFIMVITPTIIDTLWYSIVAILVTSFGLKNFFNKNKNKIKRIIGLILIMIGCSLIYKTIIFY